MSNLSRDELDEIYAFAVELGKGAGKMLTDAAQVRISGGMGTEEEKAHVQKENAVDLVTETDESRFFQLLPHCLRRLSIGIEVSLNMLCLFCCSILLCCKFDLERRLGCTTGPPIPCILLFMENREVCANAAQMSKHTSNAR